MEPPAELTPKMEPPTELTPKMEPPAELTPKIDPPAELTPKIEPPAELTPEQVKKAMSLTPGITESTIKPLLPQEWCVHSKFRLLNCDITYIPCDASEYKKVYDMVDTSKIIGKVITAIHRVENPYLYSMFLLKKAELKARYGTCSEYRLFHGTLDSNMASIVLDNFNWRISRECSVFNHGVYFTNCCDMVNTYTRYTLLVVKVLIAKPLKHDEYEDDRAQRILSRWEVYSRNPNNLEPHKIAEHLINSYKEEEAIEKEPKGVPRNNHDTIVTGDKLVTIKYDDHCFYPEYVISLGSTDPINWRL